MIELRELQLRDLSAIEDDRAELLSDAVVAVDVRGELAKPSSICLGAIEEGARARRLR